MLKNLHLGSPGAQTGLIMSKIPPLQQRTIKKLYKKALLWKMQKNQLNIAAEIFKRISNLAERAFSEDFKESEAVFSILALRHPLFETSVVQIDFLFGV